MQTHQIQGNLTICFEDPFWVAVFEKYTNEGYCASRFVLGGEPGESELFEIIQKNFRGLQFSQPTFHAPVSESLVNFKRRQREINKTLHNQGSTRKAWEATRLELEANKITRQAANQAELEAEDKRRFLQHQTKKKEKHRGH